MTVESETNKIKCKRLPIKSGFFKTKDVIFP